MSWAELTEKVTNTLTVNPLPMILKRLSIKGHQVGSEYESERAVEFAVAQGIKCYVEKFSLDQVNEAYEQ